MFFSEKAKNTLAFIFGLCFLGILWLALEAFFYLNQNYHWISPVVDKPAYTFITDNNASLALYQKLKNNKIYKWEPLLPPVEYDLSTHDRSQRQKLPCCAGGGPPITSRDFQSVLKTSSGQLIYNAHYTIDDHGRRMTPLSKNSRYNIVALGDSVTLGEGVNNEESFPFVLATFRPDAQVYNLGLSGGGANESLYEITTPPFERFQGIKKQKTIVLFSFIDDHMERLVARSVASRRPWILSQPYYIHTKGHVEFKGFFNTDRITTNIIYKWIDSDYILHFLNVVWPLRFNEDDFDFFAEMMAEMETASKKNFGDDTEFYLVIYPSHALQYGNDVAKASIRRGIHVLNYSNINSEIATGNKVIIAGEGHPSPVTQYLAAYLLDHDLPKY
jgi:hypothetical protein